MTKNKKKVVELIASTLFFYEVENTILKHLLKKIKTKEVYPTIKQSFEEVLKIQVANHDNSMSTVTL